MDEFDLFAVKSKKAKKTNSFFGLFFERIYFVLFSILDLPFANSDKIDIMFQPK